MDQRLSRTSVVCVLALVLVAAAAVAQPSQSRRPGSITGTEEWDPFNILQNGTVGWLAPYFQVTCPGSEPVPYNPFDSWATACGGEGPVLTRGVKFTAPVVSTDPRLAGDVAVVANANHDALGNGPGWGTWEETVNGGKWEGTFAAVRRLLPAGSELPAACTDDLPAGFDAWPCWVSEAQLAGHGTGAMAGSQIQLRMLFYSHVASELEFRATAEAWIVPEEKK